MMRCEADADDDDADELVGVISIDVEGPSTAASDGVAASVGGFSSAAGVLALGFFRLCRCTILPRKVGALATRTMRCEIFHT